EIVDRKTRTRRPQQIENVHGLLRILHGHRFSDLEPQRTGRHEGAAENVANLLYEILTEKLPARDVDADEQRVFAARQLLLPFRSLLGCVHQHVGAELDDEIAALGDWHEIRRTEQPELRVLPARERLKASQLLRRKRNDRLIEDADLAPLERTPQIALENDAVVPLLAHLGQEHLDPIRAAALGAVHGDL